MIFADAVFAVPEDHVQHPIAALFSTAQWLRMTGLVRCAANTGEVMWKRVSRSILCKPPPADAYQASIAQAIP